MARINLRVRLPKFITNWFPKAVWNIPGESKVVYLTFDDGPHPEITNYVLDILEKENIKATFFCVGENVFKYPEVFQKIIENGHVVGNHTYNHLQGMKTKNYAFFKNIEKADKLINSNLFRPPHGWLSREQYKFLSLKYKIIMWDVISCDYDKNLSGNRVVNNVLNFVRPGSIITFHDSLKAEKNLYHALPIVIRELKKQGYSFEKIEFEKIKNLYSHSIINQVLNRRKIKIKTA